MRKSPFKPFIRSIMRQKNYYLNFTHHPYPHLTFYLFSLFTKSISKIPEESVGQHIPYFALVGCIRIDH